MLIASAWRRDTTKILTRRKIAAALAALLRKALRSLRYTNETGDLGLASRPAPKIGAEINGRSRTRTWRQFSTQYRACTGKVTQNAAHSVHQRGTCRAAPIVLIDNLTGTIRSGALEQLLTSAIWTDRILGKTERLTMPNQTIWMGTANNLDVAGDLGRRIVFIRLDAQMERPYEHDHTSFRHPNLLDWVRENRGECVRFALILCQNWIAKGRPQGKYTMGSYQGWVEVVGGILDAAGIEGFLGSRAKQQVRTYEDSVAWRSMCQKWWQKHGIDPVGVKELFVIVAEDEIFPYVRAAEK